MRARQPRLRAGCLALLLAAVASSCAGGSSDARQDARGAQPVRSGQSEPSGPPGPLSGADAFACNGVDAILSHIRVDTARWSPTVRPFDDTVADRLASETKHLNQQALGADYSVRRAVAATADAFGEVSDAIVARSRAHLTRAIDHSRSAYSELKAVCHFSD